MLLVDLPPDIFAQILECLLSAHQARLFRTGDSGMWRLLANTPRTCSLTLRRNGDSVAHTLLATASHARSDELFLSDTIRTKEVVTNRLQSIKITASGKAPSSASRGYVDLSRFSRLHTFVYSGGFLKNVIVLPSSITHLDIGTLSDRPIHDMASLTSLTSLNLSIGYECPEGELLKQMTWPASLVSLKLSMVEPNTMNRLDHLPSTLTDLSLGGPIEQTMSLAGLPRHLTSITSLKVAFRRTLLGPVFHFPQSLTRLHVNCITSSPHTTLAAHLCSLPLHIVDFSFHTFWGRLSVDDIADVYCILLPRTTSLKRLERAILACAHRFVKAETVDLFVSALNKYGLDRRYFMLLQEAAVSCMSKRYRLLYDAHLPQPHVDLFLRGVFKSTIAYPVRGVYGHADSMKFMDWAFGFAAANRLELLVVDDLDASYALPLPPHVCANVETICIDVSKSTPLAKILSASMLKLTTIDIGEVDDAMALDEIASILYSCRRNLPQLEKVEYDVDDDDEFSESSIRMLAEMRLYHKGYGKCVTYAVSPPSWALTKYPFLCPPT